MKCPHSEKGGNDRLASCHSTQIFQALEPGGGWDRSLGTALTAPAGCADTCRWECPFAVALGAGRRGLAADLASPLWVFPASQVDPNSCGFHSAAPLPGKTAFLTVPAGARMCFLYVCPLPLPLPSVIQEGLDLHLRRCQQSPPQLCDSRRSRQPGGYYYC